MIYKHNILRYSQSTSRILAFVFLALFFAFPIQAQTVKELELQRKQTLKNLETTNILLNQTKKSQRSSLNKLTIISKNINERKMLIKNMSFEIGKLDDQIVQLDHEKTKLETNLKKLKANYAKLVQESHINRSLSAKIMFVLSAESFDQSYRRLRYLQEYSEYRKEQVRKIEGVKVQIQHKNDSLHIHKTTKVEVVKQKETETKNLTKDKQKVKVLLTDLQKREKKLRADLKIQQKKANDLNNKIASIIAEEIRKAEAKRAAIQKKRQEEEENKSKTTKSTTKTTSKTGLKTTTETSRPVTTSSSSVSVLTKEETLLSGNFERNQGRLPWPTSNGFISGHFGIHEHPVLKHVTTNNKGVYIQTPAGSSARAVFEGVVTRRFSIPGSNNGVIIQHGNYRTVYANLTQIFVREGDHVSAKQAIGKIYTDDDNDNKTELYFQVYNGRNVQNPESWIAR